MLVLLDTFLTTKALWVESFPFPASPLGHFAQACFAQLASPPLVFFLALNLRSKRLKHIEFVCHPADPRSACRAETKLPVPPKVLGYNLVHPHDLQGHRLRQFDRLGLR